MSIWSWLFWTSSIAVGTSIGVYLGAAVLVTVTEFSIRRR